MWGLDFERMHKILLSIEEYGFEVVKGDLSNITSYYSSLWLLYVNLRCYMGEEDIRSYDTAFQMVRKDITSAINTNQIKTNCVDNLMTLHSSLIMSKQFAGLGTGVEKMISGRKKIKQAFRGKEDDD